MRKEEQNKEQEVPEKQEQPQKVRLVFAVIQLASIVGMLFFFIMLNLTQMSINDDFYEGIMANNHNTNVLRQEIEDLRYQIEILNNKIQIIQNETNETMGIVVTYDVTGIENIEEICNVEVETPLIQVEGGL